MRLLCALLFALVASAAMAAEYPAVVPGMKLAFPRDHGAHPGFRTEWWYITGWLDTDEGALGFQATFFRTRPSTDDANPSAFAPKQVLLAHAALSDPKLGHLLHDQRVARAGFGLAQASDVDTDVVLDGWTLKHGSDGVFHTKVGAADFTFDLDFTPMQPAMLQGENGFSGKGPQAKDASYYYSFPHMAVSGRLTRNGRAVPVKGSAWFDHEWSSSYLNPAAVGWDWVGLNFNDGSALMGFTIRDAKGGTLWAGGTYRDASGQEARLGPHDLTIASARRWRSPRTAADYPIEPTLTLHLPSGERRWLLKPLFDDQELDSRAAGGPVYWEGAVTTEGGRGYLELTGYFRPLKM